MRMWRWPFAACLVLFVVASLGAAAPGGGQDRRFPDLQLIPLEGGDPLQFSTFRGRPVLVNFWATWCPPCRAELPELEKVYNRFSGRGLVVASVNVDRRPEPARRFVRMQKLTLPFYRISESALRALGVRSIPTSVLVDGEGRVVRVYQGFGPNILRDLEARIEALLPEEAESGGT